MTNQPSYRPLYRQIKDLIVQSLDNAEWQPGDMIPSESVLAKRYQVSQGTVRKAINEMSAENLLVRRQGKGTFVATHDDPQLFYRFLRLRPNKGESELLKSEPLSCTLTRADREVARILKINVGDNVTHIERLLCSRDKPVVVDDIYLVSDLFPGISVETMRQSSQSLYTLFESHYGVRMVRASEQIRAVAADRGSAAALSVAIGTPLLSVERIAYTYGNKAVEWRRGCYLTDHYHYANELF